MKTIATQVGAFLTTDDVAAGVLGFWRELSERRRSEIVTIPVVGEDAVVAWAQITIGHALALAVTDTSTDTELHTADATGFLQRQRDALTANVVAVDEPRQPGWDDEY